MGKVKKINIVCHKCGVKKTVYRCQLKNHKSDKFYCSKKCFQGELTFKPCPECGASFKPRRSKQVCCSKKCADIWRGKGVSEMYLQKRPRIICKHCGTVYLKKHNHKTIFCSRACAFKHHNKYFLGEVPSPIWRAGESGRKHERRAKALGVKYDRFIPKEIYERDNYICWICDGGIDRRLRFPHPKSITLDHVFPLSRGGQHIKINVAAAHLVCNMRKKDKIPLIEFSLIGVPRE